MGCMRTDIHFRQTFSTVGFHDGNVYRCGGYFLLVFTGDHDEVGFVVPKNFVTRCLIPGTLTKVPSVMFGDLLLDHKT